MKVLMWLGLIILVILAIRKKSQAVNLNQTPHFPTDEAANVQQDQGGETMVCCEHCQIYIPASESVMRGQKVFCSIAHADQA
jgi:uncharacterized protein